MTATEGTTGRAATPDEIGVGTASPAPRRQTMRAIVQTEYGSADVLRVEEVDRPTIGADEVLVRVHAAGLDRGTWHLMAGQPYLLRLTGVGLRRPKNPVPGLDVAGTVVAVGAGVTRFEVGDEVFGIGEGSFAEYATAREDKLALKPANLTFDQAAAVRGLRTHRPAGAVRDVGHVAAGQRRADHRRLGRRRHVTPCRSPRLSEQRSPACAAPPRPTWSAPSAPTTSSTTPGTTSPTARSGTTSSSTSAATPPCHGCDAH